MMKSIGMWAVAALTAAAGVFAEVPRPSEDGEGTARSGVSVRGTPASQLRLSLGGRGGFFDKGTYSFVYSDESSLPSTDSARGTLPGSGVGFGMNLGVETDVQRRPHIGVFFDMQINTYRFYGGGIGLGYNHPFVKNRLWGQVKADLAVGAVNYQFARMHCDDYTLINGVTFSDTTLDVSLSNWTLLVRPEINLFVRVMKKGIVSAGAGYQINPAGGTPKATFVGTGEDGEEASAAVELTNENITFLVNSSTIRQAPYLLQGITFNVSFILEL
jgi:hypothetical protein